MAVCRFGLSVNECCDIELSTVTDVVYPLTYPTGCLLGCLNVSDCLPQEEYRSRFPDGESDSPFVFICDSPHELPIRFPISGKHKICKTITCNEIWFALTRIYIFTILTVMKRLVEHSFTKREILYSAFDRKRCCTS